MLFAEKIKQLREEKQMPQREQIPVIAQLLQTDENMLVTLWIADKIIAAVGDEKGLAGGCIESDTKEI
jgi:hypothetical protein